ncbi:MAG: hypothetical protein ACRDAP_13215 [Shewanella sp.]
MRRRHRDSTSESDFDSESESQRGSRARNSQAANVSAHAGRGHQGLLQLLVAGVRNVLSSPFTVVGIIAGAAVAGPALSWLWGASSATNNLSAGNLPNLGGSPPPPTFDPVQNNGPIVQEPEGPPIPTLEEILASAGYTLAEQAALSGGEAQGTQTSEPSTPCLPRCPDEMVFVAPELGQNGGLPPPSRTRRMLNNGEANNFCSGPPPRVTVRPIRMDRPLFQCRDTETGVPTTSCSLSSSAYSCPAGQELEQCAGAHRGWSEAAASACVRANGLEKDITVVLEGTDRPQEHGAVASSEEQGFDSELSQFCRNDGLEIYSEEQPFMGASEYARDRIQFGSRPEDILGRRSRAQYHAQREAGQRRQDAANNNQEEARTSAKQPHQNGAQSASSSNDQSQEDTPPHKQDTDKAE